MASKESSKGKSRPVRFGIGLMSGSSCDGIDAALVRIKGDAPDIRIKLVEFRTLPYSESMKRRLLNSRVESRELACLHHELGQLFADAALSLNALATQQGHTVDFVASHGHTVAHIPPGASHLGFGTLQIGEAAIIAHRLGIPVISDFRPRDMAAGGQGAPLVPYADWLLFHRDDESVGCLNIGGIANLTIVPPDLKDVFAFDTGPGNMPIDGAVRLLTKGRHHYDAKGAGAAKGKVDDALLEQLLSHPYYEKKPPKSTGREEFDAEVYLPKDIVNTERYKPEDVMATVTRAVALSIARAYERFVKPEHTLARLIVSGGGTHNRTLMRFLREELAGLDILTSDQVGLPSDAREAIAFAILGNETLGLRPGNVPNATGASQAVVLGKFDLPG